MNKQQFNNALNKLITASSSEVILFIKRNSCHNDRKYSTVFWQSYIPVNNINSLIECDFWEDILLAYFSKNEHVNIHFLEQALSNSNSKDIIVSAKLRCVCDHVRHWQSLSILENHSNIEYRNLYKELLCIKNIKECWRDASLPYIELLKCFSYEEILIQTISYFQKFKNYSKRTIKNRPLIVSYEAILIHVLNTMLEIKRCSDIDEDLSINATVNSKEFRQRLAKELPPIKPSMFEFPKETILKKKRMLRDVIEFFFAKYDEEYQMNKYLSGFAEFQYIDRAEAELLENKKYPLYRKTLDKGQDEETYLTNIIFDNVEYKKQINRHDDLWNKEFELKRLTSLEYFEFYRLPSSIKTHARSTTELKVSDVFKLLQVFSACCMPQGRLFLNKQILKRQILDDFKKVFDTNFIIDYDEEILIEKVSQYFAWSKDYSKNIIDFLTTDISSTRIFRIDIKTRPFIKIGNQYYWLSSFLRDRKWEVLLHRRIVRDKTLNHRKQSDQAEEHIAQLFVDAGFSAKASYHYRYDGKTGEIDTIAYKDNTLFIIELKNTYPIEEMLHTSMYETTTFAVKASNQLEKAVEYVQRNFELLKEDKDLAITCDLDELKIQTMIVSNIFHADNLVFNNQHLKVSIFELAVILKNDLGKVIFSKVGNIVSKDDSFNVSMGMIQNLVSRNNVYHKDGVTEHDTDMHNLWSEDTCSAGDVVSAIKENKVFKHLDKYKHYSGKKLTINEYDLSKKYLK